MIKGQLNIMYNNAAKHFYPLAKFIIFFWLIPLIQLVAWAFDFTKRNNTEVSAVIVSSRSDKTASSFCCLIPKLENESVNIIYHSVSYANLSFCSKILNIYYFFRLSRHSNFIFLEDTFLPISYSLKWKWLFSPKVVQLWHSAGLFKRVGLHTCKTGLLKYLTKKNYSQFDVVVVSSQACRKEIAGFMGLSIEKVIALGTSYTDKYFLEEKDIKFLKGQKCRKNIVYAPTFRGEAHNVQDSPIPLVCDVFHKLKDDYNCFISPHPHDPVNLINFEFHDDLSDFLPQVDILITDYSSIAMDYLLANPEGKLILFVPDFAKFNKEVSFYVPLEKVTELIAHDPNNLLSLIKSDLIVQHSTSYRERYLTLCDGDATQRLIDYFRLSKS